ncbi:centromere protein M isoform X3 [Apteryx mantelli]|uniref:Centromere protein M n=1 Tax=Apteryx mantelli TaxID=2696672 RepID=A0A8B7IX40_9AVES|nr:PREDICTED: centromere protein M isoform X2 [Apteryx mantelli mantelli]XP_025924923.1 centromere protein M isoform X2 [Apteryx rowi]
MAVVRPFDKLPALNSAAVLLVGSDESLQQKLAEAILKEKKNFKISILKNVEASLAHVDASFFLGKVCFLVTGVGRVNYCSVEMNAIWKLGEVYCSPVLYCELELEGIRVATAQRLLRMLQICAGHIPGVSALSFGLLMRNSADE